MGAKGYVVSQDFFAHVGYGGEFLFPRQPTISGLE